MHQRDRNRGLTLIDVVAAVFIIFTALAVLLPGCAGSSLEAARRARCANSQIQLTLALQGYASQHLRLPGLKQELAGQDASWFVMLLPYLECNDLWQNWQSGVTEKEYLELTVCQSDPPPRQSRPDGPSAYIINTKVCKDGTGLSLDYITSHDGATCTLLLSENLRINKAHTWSDTDPLKVGFTDGPLAENIASNHPGGAVVSFCVGHMYFLRSTVADSVFKALVTPDGGEELDENDY
jgi:type II secretory pathway pseudopilin PulG